MAVVGGNNRRATGAYTLVVRFTGAGAEVEEHGNTRAAATEVEVNSETRGGLERAGDVDYFRVAVPGAGTLTVGTGGSTDTVGYVGGASGAWLSVNDDQGNNLNFRIVQQVGAGTYYVAVVGGEERTQTGAYTLQVGFTEDEAGDDHGDRAVHIAGELGSRVILYPRLRIQTGETWALRSPVRFSGRHQRVGAPVCKG